MTEAEARLRWCPFARVSMVHREIAINRYAELPAMPQGTTCLGADCMAWRWAYGPKSDDGYCGLAITQR